MVTIFFPFYLIIIAALIITPSHYSSRIPRLTYTRSLSVLATLFLLSYIGVLRTALTVLFSYSTIIHIPGGHQQTVWSIDASVPLFWVKIYHAIYHVPCVILATNTLQHNFVVYKIFIQFRIINCFKPILDAFQGSYKDKYYYWVAVHITMRSLLFALYALEEKLKLILSTMLLITYSVYSGYIHPHKNRLINVQELLLILNLTIMYAISYQCSGNVFFFVTNVMINLALIQFCILVLYHFITHTCHYNVEIVLKSLKDKLLNLCYKSILKIILMLNCAIFLNVLTIILNIKMDLLAMILSKII